MPSAATPLNELPHFTQSVHAPGFVSPIRHIPSWDPATRWRKANRKDTKIVRILVARLP